MQREPATLDETFFRARWLSICVSRHAPSVAEDHEKAPARGRDSRFYIILSLLRCIAASRRLHGRTVLVAA